MPATALYAYPDVIVTCGLETYQDQNRDVLLNPLMLVEVLSRSTQDYDRGHKFASYRTISSFQEYITVAHDRASIEQWVLQTSGEWRPAQYEGLGSVVPLAAVNVSLALSEIYRNVGF